MANKKCQSLQTGDGDFNDWVGSRDIIVFGLGMKVSIYVHPGGVNMKQEISQFLERINRLKKEGKLDLSSEEDLSLAVMNLISLEEHFYFTGAKTGKEKYYDLLNQVREIRQELLKKLVGKTEGEVWCIAKHLLAASMRLIEVGTKYQGQGKKKEAEDFFAKAWSLYSLFWGIRLGLVEVGKLKKVDEEKLNIESKEVNLQDKLEDLIKKIVVCC